ncbi:hypothetical protein OEZ49_17975 [Ruegeria sp. WL0004]|uniref:Uncharacterized protein n=1 Tax=Ruegeria marisflavi TaxID=2984152 RepID=A0ABT2WUU7_9RHOB|nr:hypothetical protein [Ruegeria sp. WL0004]MCU9839666.1 hypothetical protein [Ruegeria sp. WL0004]
MTTKTIRNGIVVSEGDPNQVNPGCNQMATNTFGSGAAPSAAERAAEGMKRYADYQKENARALALAEEREKERREQEYMRKHLRQQLSHKDIYG